MCHLKHDSILAQWLYPDLTLKIIGVFSVLNLVYSTNKQTKKTQPQIPFKSEQTQHNSTCILKPLVGYYIKKRIIVHITNILNLGESLLLMKLLSWRYVLLVFLLYYYNTFKDDQCKCSLCEGC